MLQRENSKQITANNYNLKIVMKLVQVSSQLSNLKLILKFKEF